ncbi:unnamed protein product [Rotaria magnacalcarata]|uniref:Uncharacterized protein n=1 Tax=Rotaria magnacalcarata TaxID=392030 RepID=A0A819LMQ8_9BILA|nr:unnamed protein product [Rotaria magnacalcarata]CAF3879175.1 unnamed protein product [Rotaria magnacalcarata]CAF3966907.1 unnamed protein product [Rotaria magnacalcarata]
MLKSEVVVLSGPGVQETSASPSYTGGLYMSSAKLRLLQILRSPVLTNEDTTSSSRVYMKNLFLELAESIAFSLFSRTLVEYFDGLFPRNDPKKTRFSINFFTSIGRSDLTDDLQEFIRANRC